MGLREVGGDAAGGEVESGSNLVGDFQQNVVEGGVRIEVFGRVEGCQQVAARVAEDYLSLTVLTLRPNTRDEAINAIIDLINRKPGVDYYEIATELHLRIQFTIDLVDDLVEQGLIVAQQSTQESDDVAVE